MVGSQRLRGLVGLFALLAGVSVPSLAAGDLSASLTAEDDGRVRYTLASEEAQPILLLPWNTPAEELSADLFTVTRGDRRFGYRGPQAVRGSLPVEAVPMEQPIELPSGGSIDRLLDLAAAYGLDEAGEYRVELSVPVWVRGDDGGWIHRSLAAEALTLSLGAAAEGSRGSDAGRTGTATQSLGVEFEDCEAASSFYISEANVSGTSWSKEAFDYLDSRADYVIYWAAFDGQRWRRRERIQTTIKDVPMTPTRMGVEAFGERLFMYFIGFTRFNIYESIFDGKDWFGNKQLETNPDSHPRTSTSPGMAVFEDQLYLFYRSQGRTDISWTSFDGEGWHGNEPVVTADGSRPQTVGTPAVTVFGERLQMVYRGQDEDVLYSASFDGETWSGNRPIELASGERLPAIGSPSLAVFGDRLHVIYRDGRDSALSWATFDGASWSGGEAITTRAGERLLTVDGGALASFGGRLHGVYRGLNEAHLAWIEYDGKGWVGRGFLETPEGRLESGTVPALVPYGDELLLFYRGGWARPSKAARYNAWLGEHSRERHAKAISVLADVRQSFDKKLSFSCSGEVACNGVASSCSAGNVAFSCVGGSDRTLWLCPEFWQLPPDRGQDSQAGALIQAIAGWFGASGKVQTCEAVRELAEQAPDEAALNAAALRYLAEKVSDCGAF
ncbi:MAG: M35 family metallo-endopeptidase [Acidobacteriota bacterium]